MLLLLPFVLSLAAAPRALAMIAPPHPRIFASDTGRTGMKVLPNGRSSTAILFTLANDGSEKVLWRRKLPNVPGDVLIFDAREDQTYVVTLDSWGAAGGDHALVVYDKTGTAVQDLRAQDLLPEHARRPLLVPRDGGQPWRDGAIIELLHPPDGPRLQIRFRDGRDAHIALPGGPVTPAQQPVPSSAPAQ